MSEMLLAGRTALVTGAGRGLGKAMVLALLRQGARVALSSTDLASLEETIQESGAPKGATIAILGNLEREDEVHAIAREATRAFGHIDILINNAGISVQAIRRHGPKENVSFREASGPALRRFFEINAIAPHLLALDLVEGMIERRWGRIINISTSLDTMLKRIAYGGSKAALEAHSAMMAKELEGTGVTVNMLLPGGQTATRMTAGFGIPASEMLQPEIMVAPVLWLCSEASNGTTGRRYIAARWDAAQPADKAEKVSGAPIAWAGLGVPAILPPGSL